MTRRKEKNTGELRGPTRAIPLFADEKSLLCCDGYGALILKAATKMRHKAELIRIIANGRDEECWIPNSQHRIEKGKLIITEFIFDKREQARPMGCYR